MERQPHLRHLLARLLLGLALLGAGSVIVTGVVAQGESKKEEEESGKQKVKPRIKVEEEEGAKPNSKVARAADPSESAAPKLPELDGADLLTAANQAKNPLVRDFLFAIAKPHDIVYTKSGRSRVIQPVELYLGK